jgi:kynurenine formamidase
MSGIIDITMSYKEPMRGFTKSVARRISEDGWNATDLHIYSHAGTHMDAPMHFNINPLTIDEIPPHRFISDCHIIKVQVKNDSQIITVDDLGMKADQIKEMESVIFQTGWSRYSDDLSIYRDKLPRIGEDLAKWLVRRKVNLIGVEPPSVADVNNLVELQLIHRILLEGNILILEGLTNLEAVQKDFVKLLALPLKVHKGDGAPVRALIMEE